MSPRLLQRAWIAVWLIYCAGLAWWFTRDLAAAGVVFLTIVIPIALWARHKAKKSAQPITTRERQ